MGALELREKLIEQFNLFIQDESKLYVLEGIFDSMNTARAGQSNVPEQFYDLVEERKRKYHAGETTGSSWHDVKRKLIEK